MLIRNSVGLAVLAVMLGFCPSLLAVSYSWNFTGSAGSNCTPSGTNRGACSNLGNSIVFNTTPGGATVTATAWYVNGNSTLQQAALGQYSNGLGVCYQSGFSCTQEVSFDEYVLLTFSAPVNAASVTITAPTGGGLEASYWLGSSAIQSTSLTGQGMASLASLGFDGMTNSTGGNGGTRTVDLTGGVPGSYVHAILFGTQYNFGGDFTIEGLAASATSSVPEPSSVILLFTVTLLGLGLGRMAVRRPLLVKKSPL